MDLRSFSSSHPLLVLWSVGSPALVELRAALRLQGGRLRWNGAVTPVPTAQPTEQVLSPAGVRALLRGELVVLPVTHLPSEVRRIEQGIMTLRAWQEAAAVWQLVVPGEAHWSDVQARDWKRALDARLGGLLYQFWRARRWVVLARSGCSYLHRRLAYAIDKGGRVR